MAVDEPTGRIRKSTVREGNDREVDDTRRPSGGKEMAKEVTFALADSDLKKAQGSSRTRSLQA